MKQSLREIQEARTLRNTIATLKTQVEYILWLLGDASGNAEITFGDCLITINVEDTITVDGKLYARVVGDTLG